jgi:D-sedoheptulose 7-phosphate isomerase
MATQETETAILELLKEHREALADLEHKVPGIIKMRDMLLELISRDGTLLLCGNGGSAADCIHWAAEWRVRFKNDRRALRAEALVTDVSTLTAAGNDLGFETIFSRQIEAVGRKGDILVAISTSGNSENIIKAIESAKQKGIVTIGFGGKDGGRMAKIVDVPFIINATATARIQEMHEFTMHILCELVDRELGA